MKIKCSFLVLIALAWLGRPAIAQTSSISYRGRLTAAGALANGPYDMEFRLFAISTSGTQQGDTKSQPAVPVTNGVFTVTLDFGATVFDGSPRFLEIGVRASGGAGPYALLAPRQQITSIPYAIHSLSAGTATNLVNGTAVRSLNNLKDNVTLAAGANVTITPSGNTLTIASPGGGGGSGLWALAGNDAFYNAGNVGIGTSTPTPGIRLDVVGATLLRPGNGNIQFGSPNAELGLSIIPTAGNRADVRFDGSTLKLLAGSGQTPASSASGLAITTAGNVGIGTTTPTAGYRLEVNGAMLMKPGNGTVQFGSPNAELGLSITPTAGNRADLRFDGSVLKLVASTGVVPPSADNGLAVTTAGRVGIGTTAPDAKLHVETTQPGTVVYGHALGAGGVGVYGNAPNPGGIGVLGSAGAGGTAVHADGNATQKLDKGGFVKALAYINPFLPAAQYVVRSYNSQPGATINVTRSGPGIYTIDFGFNVSDRFFSVTSRGGTLGGSSHRIGTGTVFETSGNTVRVVFNGTDDSDVPADFAFYIIVY